MSTGRVKWFNNSKGYGFIVPDESGEDLFAHYSSIKSSGFRTLNENDLVEFDIQQGPKGLQAVNIKLVESSGSMYSSESDLE